MNNFLFIDSEINILKDEEAKSALEHENDKTFLSYDKGIIKIPIERWKKAQIAERNHWMKLSLKATDDRNYEHQQYFKNYSAISTYHFKNTIELGCGPFTNLRLIGRICQIEKCSLLDPLLNEYLLHPHCTYNKEKLLIDDNNKIIIDELINNSIEEIETDKKYDLVVVINVFEHCFDVELCFKKILSILKSGGCLIFHDRYYDHLIVTKQVEMIYDAAHPLKIDKLMLNDFLSKNFETLFSDIIEKTFDFMNEKIEYQALYFMGIKKPD